MKLEKCCVVTREKKTASDKGFQSFFSSISALKELPSLFKYNLKIDIEAQLSLLHVFAFEILFQYGAFQ